MFFWGDGWCLGKQRNAGQPQSWSACPPRRYLYPRSRAKRGTREHAGSQTKVITCPYFISSFQKQYFRGWRRAIFSFLSPKLLLPPFILVHTWLGEMRLRFFCFSSQPLEATQLWEGEAALCKGVLNQGSYSYPHSLVPGSTKLLWSDPKVQKASEYWQLSENFKQVAPGFPKA